MIPCKAIWFGIAWRAKGLNGEPIRCWGLTRRKAEDRWMKKYTEALKPLTLTASMVALLDPKDKIIHTSRLPEPIELYEGDSLEINMKFEIER